MTLEESSLQSALDANPHEQTLRIALADHLEDIGDPRAEGYRAMAAIGFVPMNVGGSEWGNEIKPIDWEIGHRDNHHRKGWNRKQLIRPDVFDLQTVLPFCWFVAIESNVPANSGSRSWWRYLRCSRREAEDIVALAFLKLTDAQKTDAVNFDTNAIPEGVGT